MQAKHLALLITALAVLSVSLVACSAGPIGNPINNNPGNLIFSTPDASQFTPTPGFPVFTIGTWPSNYSPGINDTITIYVVCRVQDTKMLVPPQPPNPPVGVTVVLDPPINDTLHGTTGPDGIAAISYTLNDPYVGQPVMITASAFYAGRTYFATTFITTGVTTAPTATPGGTPGPTATP
ncbi:MAG TPA: hypothetical protein VF818_05205 [Ktedonobacterales bacterium]